MTTGLTNIDNLEGMLERTVGINNAGQAERDRDLVKTGALLSIARSLESNKVPDHWQALEAPSGAILGWFDPQVAESIAGALARTQAAQADDADDALPIEVGSMVSLTAELEQALDTIGGTVDDLRDLVAMGEVVDLGVDQDQAWALVRWQDHPAAPPNGRLWVSLLTVLEQREGEAGPVDEPELRGDLGGSVPTAELIDGNPPAELDDDDLDEDFDTVVEAEPAKPVDGLSALKGKSNKRK